MWHLGLHATESARLYLPRKTEDRCNMCTGYDRAKTREENTGTSQHPWGHLLTHTVPHEGRITRQKPHESYAGTSRRGTEESVWLGYLQRPPSMS